MFIYYTSILSLLPPSSLLFLKPDFSPVESGLLLPSINLTSGQGNTPPPPMYSSPYLPPYIEKSCSNLPSTTITTLWTSRDGNQRHHILGQIIGHCEWNNILWHGLCVVWTRHNIINIHTQIYHFLLGIFLVLLRWGYAGLVEGEGKGFFLQIRRSMT